MPFVGTNIVTFPTRMAAYKVQEWNPGQPTPSPRLPIQVLQAQPNPMHVYLPLSPSLFDTPDGATIANVISTNALETLSESLDYLSLYGTGLGNIQEGKPMNAFQGKGYVKAKGELDDSVLSQAVTMLLNRGYNPDGALLSPSALFDFETQTSTTGIPLIPDVEDTGAFIWRGIKLVGCDAISVPFQTANAQLSSFIPGAPSNATLLGIIGDFRHGYYWGARKDVSLTEFNQSDSAIYADMPLYRFSTAYATALLPDAFVAIIGQPSAGTPQADDTPDNSKK